MQVRVCGLTNATHYNGREGVLIGMSDAQSGAGANATGRWNIRLLDGDVLSLKPSNMQTSGASPSISTMIAALERAGEHEKAATLRSMFRDVAS